MYPVIYRTTAYACKSLENCTREQEITDTALPILANLAAMLVVGQWFFREEPQLIERAAEEVQLFWSRLPEALDEFFSQMMPRDND